MLSEAIKEFWPMILAGIAFAVWLVRLEGLVKANAQAIHMMQEYHEEMQQIHRSVGEVKSQITEVKTDIRWLKDFGSKLLMEYNGKQQHNNK